MNVKSLASGRLALWGIVLMAILALSLLPGCSSSGSSQASTSSSGTEASVRGGVDEGSGMGQAFVGTWDLMGMYPVEMDSEPTDEEMRDIMSTLTDVQVEMYLVLNEDGTAAEAFFGGNRYGKWMPIDETSIALVLGGEQLNLILDDSRITYEDDNDFRYVFEKGEDKEIVPYEEYAAFLDAFMGQWEGVSMSRDGEEVQMESGYLIYDMQKNGDIVMSGSYSEEATTLKWFFSNTKRDLFEGAPSQNITLRIEDGYLVRESTGEHHWVTKYRAM